MDQRGPAKASLFIRCARYVEQAMRRKHGGAIHIMKITWWKQCDAVCVMQDMWCKRCSASNV
eukprot:1872753-Pyramimonas_sp.AAC.1